MSRRFTRWIRSKSGTWMISGVLVVLLIIMAIGVTLGWWQSLIDLLSGTVAPPSPSYPAPQSGYTCLPTCFDGITDYDGDGTPEPQDGKFLLVSGKDMATFAGSKIVVWISVPGDYTSFDLSIFDGDAAKDNEGNLNRFGGNWDDGWTETTYTLYPDPLKAGNQGAQIGEWLGNRDMPNNAWYDISVDNVPEAQGPSGHYFYRLEVTMPPEEGSGGNAFKLRSNAYLSTGQGEIGDDRDDLVNASFAIVGAFGGPRDISVLYPEFTGNYSNPGPSTYTGDWQFYFYVPEETQTLTI